MPKSGTGPSGGASQGAPPGREVGLLGKMEERRADGYKIVRDFLQQQDGLGTHPYDEIDKGKSSPYTSGLVERRPDYDFPAWELIEVISFGRFIHSYKFCADKFDNRRMRNDFYMLQSVKGLRNGCAHSTASSTTLGRRRRRTPHEARSRAPSGA